ncbi:MAG: nucleotidyltransferase family protein [Patescibacteria group bacterium]|nr:nucleotidyltransferase family protein [Patescibacteria group bacterium]
MKTNIEQIKKKALPILKEAGVTRSALFGSYVRGEEGGESDIDLLIDLPAEKSLLDLIRLQRKLQETLKRKVDLLTYNAVNPLLKEYIQKDQLIIL